MGEGSAKAEVKRHIVGGIKTSAKKLRLGNRPSACRKHYAHRAILDSHMEGA